jgi:hypothetical protein
MVFRHLNGPMVQPRGDREKTGYTGDKKSHCRITKKVQEIFRGKDQEDIPSKIHPPQCVKGNKQESKKGE